MTRWGMIRFACFPLLVFQGVASLIMPPADRMRMGPMEIESLQSECVKASGHDFHCIWKPDTAQDYQVATTLFTILATQCDGRKPIRMWLPSCRNRQGEVDRLVKTIHQHSRDLGGLSTHCLHWPDVPATMVEFTWNKDASMSSDVYEKETESQIETAVQATEQYVENKLCKLGLCPYTKSMKRAAIGLESLGIKEGPIIVRHSATINPSTVTTPAAVAAATLWQGISELVERPEHEVSSLLLIAPSCYDSDFLAFCNVCDNLIEQSLKVLISHSIGKVWFHPLYKLEQTTTSAGGHTIPLHALESFMDQYLVQHPGASRPNEHDMAIAHDKTRKTPHATLNLLRGPQLSAVRENENRGKVYARNVLSILKLKQGISSG